MIKGILFFEDGNVQIIGDLSTARHIIASINTVLPQLQEQEKKALLDNISAEDLEKLLEQKRAK